MKQGKKLVSDFKDNLGALPDFTINFFLFLKVFRIFPLHGLFHRKKKERKGKLELKLFGKRKRFK